MFLHAFFKGFSKIQFLRSVALVTSYELFQIVFFSQTGLFPLKLKKYFFNKKSFNYFSFPGDSVKKLHSACLGLTILLLLLGFSKTVILGIFEFIVERLQGLVQDDRRSGRYFRNIPYLKLGAGLILTLSQIHCTNSIFFSIADILSSIMAFQVS